MPLEWTGDTVVDLCDRAETAYMEAGARMALDLGEHFRDNIEVNTPVETRRLRDSYEISPIHYGPVMGLGYVAYAWEGTVFTEVSYAEYVERGTGLWGPKHAKYKIEPKTPGGVLAFEPYMRHASGAVVLDIGHNVVKGGTIMVRYVMHPGSPGAAMFRIGAVITEHEADEWSYRALRMWERATQDKHLATVESGVRA